MHFSQPTIEITRKYFPHLSVHEDDGADAKLSIEEPPPPPPQGLFCAPFSSPLFAARILRPRLARRNANAVARRTASPSGPRFARIPKFGSVGVPSKDGNNEGGEEEDGGAKGRSSWGDMPKFLLAGAVSTIISRTSVAPLERIKLECIVHGSTLSWMNVVTHIWAAEGIKGFWKGNLLNLFRMIPFKSINFICYDMYLDRLHRIPGRGGVANRDRLIGGGLSGVLATVICLPLDTIRTRLVAPGGEALGGVAGCFAHMVRNEGFLSLYKGLTPALISMGPASAVFYAVYDALKTSYLSGRRIRSRSKSQSEKEAELGPARTLLYGAFAGACAETVTYPLEVIRRQLQLEQAASVGLIAAFVKVVERDGFGSLFAGLVPSTLQVLPSASLSYFFYETMKSILKIN